MVALAVAAMPSSRPVKPSFSLVVALTATREMLTPVMSAIRARIWSRSGPIFGRSQISVTSRLATRPPRAVTRSIDEGMEADVAVGMSEEALYVRHAHAADHHMVARTESVHVIAGAGPDIAEQACKARLFADEVFGSRQFHVGNIAFKGRDRQSHPLGKRRVVREIIALVARGSAVRVQDRIEAEHLRRLCDAQPRALGGCFDVAAAVHKLDRVGNRNRRDRRAGARHGIDGARDQRLRDEGTCGVMNQNNVRLLRRDRLETGMHRFLPR
jgi:hypothetical protein